MPDERTKLTFVFPVFSSDTPSAIVGVAASFQARPERDEAISNGYLSRAEQTTLEQAEASKEDQCHPGQGSKS